MKPRIPITYGLEWWYEMEAIEAQLGPTRFRKWLTEQLREDAAWKKVVMMMAWNDRNSEYNLDPAIADHRVNRDGEDVPIEAVVRDVQTMFEGLRPA